MLDNPIFCNACYAAAYSMLGLYLAWTLVTASSY